MESNLANKFVQPRDSGRSVKKAVSFQQHNLSFMSVDSRSGNKQASGSKKEQFFAKHKDSINTVQKRRESSQEGR